MFDNKLQAVLRLLLWQNQYPPTQKLKLWI